MLRKFLKSGLVIKRHVSALYVTGDKAMENCVVVNPYLEIDKRFSEIDEIKENFKARNSRLNLDEIVLEYEMYSDIEKRKKELEIRRAKLGKLCSENPKNEGLKMQGRNAKEDFKTLRENSYFLEDKFIHNFLKLPNKLHHRTPKDGKRKIVHNFLEPSTEKFMSKLDGFMEYFNSQSYYLNGNAALFDLEFPLQVSDYFRDNKFVKISSPDFVRSVVPQVAGVELDRIFLLKEDAIENRLNNLHLCGNGTYLSYLPFIAKLLTQSTQYPFKLVNSGKIYSQQNEESEIYNLVQSTGNSIFIASLDDTTFDEILDEQLEHIKKVYEPLNLHYRVSIYPANELEVAESFKLGIEVFSPFYQKYIEVGNFSYLRDFISKRLLFIYKEGKENHFPHMYAGNIANTTKLLINIIECKGEI